MSQTPTPAFAGTRTSAAGQAIPSSRETRHAAPQQRRIASRPITAFANATLALVLILAVFGGWRAWDTLRNTGSPPPATSVPGMAMLPATPDDAVAAVEPTEPAYACDFSRDIPIFQQVDESPVDGTTLVLTAGGDLLLTCPEELEPIILATEVNAGQVGPAGYPGLVSFWTPQDGTTSGFITYVSIFNGASIKAGIPPESLTMPNSPSGDSPWLVTNSFDNPGIWEITDLRTMQTRIMDDFVESDVPPGVVIVPGGTPVIADASGDTLVMGIMTRSDIDAEGALFKVEGLPGALLVLDGSFDNAHWIDVPNDLGATRDLALSPDGQFLVLRSSVDASSPASPVNYSIVRTTDGEELGRSDDIAFVDSVSEVKWVQDGRAITFTDNEALMTLAAEAGARPQTVLQSNALLTDLGTTYDPDVVLVTRMQAEEVATETPDLVQPLIYSVNTRTGKTIDFEGVDVSQNTSPWLADTRFLVLAETHPAWMDDSSNITLRVVDAVTGDTIETIQGITYVDEPGGPSMGPRGVASTIDGHVEIVAFNVLQILAMESGPNGSTVRMLPSPRPESEAYSGILTLWLSDDGTRLSLSIDGDESGTRYLLDLTDPNAEWLAVPPQPGAVQPGYGSAFITFVAGMGD